MLARWSWLLHRSTIYRIPPSVDVRVVKRPGAPLYQSRFFCASCRKQGNSRSGMSVGLSESNWVHNGARRNGRCGGPDRPLCERANADVRSLVRHSASLQERPPGSRDLLATRFIGGLAVVEYGVDAVLSK